MSRAHQGISEAAYQRAVGKLRDLLSRSRPGAPEANALAEGRAEYMPGTPSVEEIIRSREQVLARYGPVFSPDRLGSLTKEEFGSFLYIENNRHWTGLYRHPVVMKDMSRLREALRELLDESKPLAERYTSAWEKTPGMGKGLATAVLTVANPDKCGVWNNISEAAMLALGIWPEFPRGSSRGARYVLVNEVLLRLTKDIPIDLWTLDALWWKFAEEGKASPEPGIRKISLDSGRFALESQLEDFIVENWQRTELAKEWEVYHEDEEDQGQQFPTDIGRIDILAKHRKESRWLIIELKRDQTDDDTVGQVLRYMSWVRKHLAKKGDAVEGLIVVRPPRPGDTLDKLQYALEEVTGKVRLMYYEVQFKLRDPN